MEVKQRRQEKDKTYKWKRQPMSLSGNPQRQMGWLEFPLPPSSIQWVFGRKRRSLWRSALTPGASSERSRIQGKLGQPQAPPLPLPWILKVTSKWMNEKACELQEHVPPLLAGENTSLAAPGLQATKIPIPTEQKHPGKGILWQRSVA